jgi:hypothetical protein
MKCPAASFSWYHFPTITGSYNSVFISSDKYINTAKMKSFYVTSNTIKWYYLFVEAVKKWMKYSAVAALRVFGEIRR